MKKHALYLIFGIVLAIISIVALSLSVSLNFPIVMMISMPSTFIGGYIIGWNIITIRDLKRKSNEDIPNDEYDINFKPMPANSYTMKVKIKSVEKGKPTIDLETEPTMDNEY